MVLSSGGMQTLKPVIIELIIAFPITFTSEHHKNAGYAFMFSLHLATNKEFSETTVIAFTAELHLLNSVQM